MIDLVLAFNANQPKSLRSLQSTIDSQNEPIDGIPTVLVAYYGNNKRQDDDEIFDKKAAKFEKEFKCKYFEVCSNSNDIIIEEIFNHLFAMVPRESVKDKRKKRIRQKSKRKVTKK